MALQVTTAVFNPLFYGVAVQLKFFFYFSRKSHSKKKHLLLHREIEAVVEMGSLGNGLVCHSIVL